MEAAAAVRRLAFHDRLPWLAGLYTQEEDEEFFRSVLFARSVVWGAFADGSLVGMMALKPGWIDQLYVLPARQRGGIGTRLLEVAQATYSELQLWTFQRNSGARRFYVRHGFLAVEQTDGSANEEREPDVRYRWCSSSSSPSWPDFEPGAR